MSGAAPELRLRLATAELAAATGGAWLAGTGAAPSALCGVSIDSRTIGPEELFVAVAGPCFDGHDFLAQARARGAAAALVERDVQAPDGLPLLRVADTKRALGALARHVRLAAALPVVAVTGSVGKTTTKEMAATLLEARGPVLKTQGNLNNRYGLPLTLLRLEPRHRTAVVELGMSAAGELRELSDLARPDVAVITRVAPVHLEFFASLEDVARAKAEVLEGLAPGGVAVLNHDDPHLRRLGRERRGRVIWFGRERACEVSAENWRGALSGMRFELRVAGRGVDVALPLPGRHHLTNFLAAAAAAHALGVTPESMAEAALRLRPARHRGELLRLGRNVTLLDDCYNSSPAAVEAAVETLGLASASRRVAFLGDMLELGASGPELHRQAGAGLVGRVDLVIGVGALAAHVLEGARAAGFAAGALSHFEDAPAAAAAAAEIVRPGDTVLVKGSRGVRLEALVDALVARFGPGPEER